MPDEGKPFQNYGFQNHSASVKSWKPPAQVGAASSKPALYLLCQGPRHPPGCLLPASLSVNTLPNQSKENYFSVRILAVSESVQCGFWLSRFHSTLRHIKWNLELKMNEPFQSTHISSATHFQVVTSQSLPHFLHVLCLLFSFFFKISPLLPPKLSLLLALSSFFLLTWILIIFPSPA